MNKPLVYILILNWNGKEDTLECLSSLKKIDYPNYKTIVIDNGSTDDSVKIINKKYPKIKIIENKKNLGYAEGNNVGIRYALKNKADYVLILNNDTIVDKKFLTELVKVGESNEKVGIVGPNVYCYFFQAEDGIRDWSVTGVQTCALPILARLKKVSEFLRKELEVSTLQA